MNPLEPPKFQNPRVGHAVVLGGGPTGLSTAWRLVKHGWRVTVLEKDKELGGHGGTRTIHGYDVDDGPHKLYPQVPCAQPLIEHFVGADLLRVSKRNTIHLFGTYIPFPFGLGDLLQGLGPVAFLQSGAGFVLGKLERLFRGQPKTYSAYVIALYGRYAHRLVFRNFAEKLWGNPDELDAHLARTRIIAPSISELVIGLISKFRNKPQLSASSFFYPRKGLRQLWEAMGKEIVKHGGVILRETTPSAITRPTPTSFSVATASTQGTENITADIVISTIPIRTTFALLAPASPARVQQAIDGLRASSLLIIYVVVRAPRVLPVSWIFFPEPQWHFARISEQKSFSETMIPADRTVLMVEVPMARSQIRTLPREQLIAEALAQLREVGVLKPEHEVIETFTGYDESIYPIYDLAYRQNLDTILAHSDGIPGLYLNGRHGLFCYNNMDHSMEMGLALADHIASGVPLDAWRARRATFYEYKIVD